MKKLVLSMLIGVASICHVAMAGEASLHIHVAGTSKNNTYFLYVEGVGCVSMFEADHGKVYPLSDGKVDRIFMVNSGNMQVYTQPLPASCNVTVSDNQVMTVSGKVVQAANGNAYIKGLHCTVS